MTDLIHFCRSTYDELLAAPAGENAAVPTSTVVRAATSFASHDERFLLKNKDYDRQYAQLYFYRLLQMRGHVEAAAKRAWPGIRGARRAACQPDQMPAASAPAFASTAMSVRHDSSPYVRCIHSLRHA